MQWQKGIQTSRKLFLVRVRKEVRMMSRREREDFLQAVNMLKEDKVST